MLMWGTDVAVGCLPQTQFGSPRIHFRAVEGGRAQSLRKVPPVGLEPTLYRRFQGSSRERTTGAIWCQTCMFTYALPPPWCHQMKENAREWRQEWRLQRLEDPMAPRCFAILRVSVSAELTSVVLGFHLEEFLNVYFRDLLVRGRPVNIQSPLDTSVRLVPLPQ